MDVLDIDNRVVLSADDHLGDGGRSERSTILEKVRVKGEKVGGERDRPCRQSHTCGHGGGVVRRGGSSACGRGEEEDGGEGEEGTYLRACH